MKLIYHRAAEAELVAAARFYEQKVQALGVQFLDEFERCIAKIIEAKKNSGCGNCCEGFP